VVRAADLVAGSEGSVSGYMSPERKAELQQLAAEDTDSPARLAAARTALPELLAEIERLEEKAASERVKAERLRGIVEYLWLRSI
jgi:hypothetical protein